MAASDPALDATPALDFTLDAAELLTGSHPHETAAILESVGFSDWRAARERFAALCPDEASREALGRCLPMLLASLSDAATPDASLINFERFVHSVDDRAELFEYLAQNPRAVEILVKLFVGSQFLTEILLRNPGYLEELTQHRQLADFKSREQIVDEAGLACDPAPHLSEKLDALRRFQHRELLRIGACDAFGLFDLKSVTVQLSLLADSVVQTCLRLLARELDLDPRPFVVLAFGKLGGEELNYSSDIDLVFLAEGDATRFWPLGQRLIRAIQDATREGFLYRVDMRLRPWGKSGALVNTPDAHVEYLKRHGMLWEKQALIKARPIAGNLQIGAAFLERVQPLLYFLPVEELRNSVHEMKQKIEAGLERQGRSWGEVKSGAGSIRDVEFVAQFLQLAHGGAHPEVRSINTLDALVRLADFGFLRADEYRQLSDSYVFLRTIEHSLQLMHHKQTHSLPEDRRELGWLARRLDFAGADGFLAHYERHTAAVRRIYERYIEERDGAAAGEASADETAAARMQPAYLEAFTEPQLARHAQLLARVAADDPVQVEAQRADGDLWRVTIAGYDHPGDLSMICGLLFAHGFNIVGGQVFSAERTPASAGEPRKFVDVILVRSTKGNAALSVAAEWDEYRADLADLMRQLAAGNQREAHGRLAKLVAAAVEAPADSEPATLYPVNVAFDNHSDPEATVLTIDADDTVGFLYELSNALSLAGIDVSRMVIETAGARVRDTLYVTDTEGRKLTDPARHKELQSTVALIKHFTHLLPRSPNPESALLHFREFLERLYERPGWVDELSSLEQSEVLDALARLLGVSDFLWEDFLRLQHENLFPVLADVEALARGKSREELAREIEGVLAARTPP